MATGRGRWWGVWVAAGLVVGGRAQARQAEIPPPLPMPPQADAPEGGGPPGAEILTRGPIHEAFAEPVVFDPRPGPVVPKEPPAPIEEVPPDQKPQGEEVAWIPGYWGWDDERQDFVWVSGLWRQPPPGRQWVPGYWLPAEGGFRWIPGSWAASDVAAAAQYLPTPPETLEQGPSSPQPVGDYTWAPGNWVWSAGDRYAWQPGYWVPIQQDWTWVPPYYTYSPYGCLYHTGYWDYTLARRGQLFAPVYFAQPVYAQPNFVYTPSVGLLGGALLASLFVRPQYHQYYFGDYYAPNYAQSGIYPWYSVHHGRSGYDPLYSQMAVIERRRNPGWSNQLQEEYRFRRDHPEARPARTFVAQRAQALQRVLGGRDLALARPLTQLAGGPGARFERLDPGRREALRVQATQVQQLRVERLRQEGGPRPAGNPGGRGPGPRRLDLPRSPIASAPRGGAGRVEAVKLRETQLEAQKAQAARQQQAAQAARQRQAEAVRQQRETAAARQQQTLAARQQREAETARQQQEASQAARQEQLRQQADRQQQAEAARQQQQAAQAARQQREAEAVRQRQEQALRQQQAAQAAQASRQQQAQAARQQQQAAQAARRAQTEAARQRPAQVPRARPGG